MICENFLYLSWIVSQLFFLFVCLFVGWFVGWLKPGQLEAHPQCWRRRDPWHTTPGVPPRVGIALGEVIQKEGEDISCVKLRPRKLLVFFFG